MGVVTSDCLTIVKLDGTVTVTRLDHEVDLWHRAGDGFSDAHGSWHVDDVRCEERCLVIVEVDLETAFPLPELLAA